jgi:hypothetical protein
MSVGGNNQGRMISSEGHNFVVRETDGNKLIHKVNKSIDATRIHI